MGHSHGQGVEVGEGVAVPSVTIEVLPDPVMGWNVFAAVADFRFDPAAAGQDHVDGEGHAHLYVDGAKIARVYGPAFHIKDLEPGTHEVTLTLNANDHRTYLHDGNEIAASATIDVPEPSGDGEMHSHGMDHEAVAPPPGAAIPTVAIEVTPDPVMGWNVHFPTSGFTFVPEKAGMEAAWGEGHTHLYVNGQKVARPYGEWYHLKMLDPGRNEIRVTLNHNDHSDYALDGEVIAATATVMVEGMTAADRTIEIAVGGEGFRAERHQVELGETVALAVTMPQAGTVHVHGYDVYVPADAGTVAEARFTANIPGVFEVEDEDSGLLIAEIEVG